MFNCLREIATGILLALPVVVLILAAPYLEKLL